jgi:hypothetical protein
MSSSGIRSLNTVMAVFVAILLFLTCAPPACATAQLWLTDGTTTVKIVDNGSGDLSSTPGVLLYNDTLGVFDITVRANTKPAYSPINPTAMDLFTFTLTSGGPGTLRVMFSDTDFSGAVLTGGMLHVGGTFSGTGSLSVAGYEDNTNTLFGTQNFVGAVTSNVPGSFSGDIGAAFPVAAPPDMFSLTEIATINFTGAGSTSFDAELSAVPEPASFALLGGLILLTVPVLRRKRG